MALAHVVREAGGMRDDERGRVFAVLRGDFRSPFWLRRTSRARARESPFAITSETGVWFGANLVLNEGSLRRPSASHALTGRKV
jgi:hypothetical protein